MLRANTVRHKTVRKRMSYGKAGELGSSSGYYNLGNSYDRGLGVEVDLKKAKHYHELAAIAGVCRQGITLAHSSMKLVIFIGQ